MTDLIAYLNALKDRLEIKSVNQFAIRIGISQSTMDAILKGKMIPKEEICEKIAILADDKPEIIIALAGKSRAKKSQRKYWDHIIKAVTAATFLVLLTFPTLAQASTLIKSNLPELYIMSNLTYSGSFALDFALLSSLLPAINFNHTSQLNGPAYELRF